MFIKLKEKTIICLFLILSISKLINPQHVFAQTQEWGNFCIHTLDGTTAPTIQGLQCAIANVLSVFISIVGLAGFVMLIYGSVKLMLSGGNSGGTEEAQKTMTFAVVGIVVVLSSFIILNLISSFTGVSLIKTFAIPNWTRNW